MRLALGDDAREVSVREAADGISVAVGGRTLRFEISPLADGSFLLQHDRRCEAFRCVRDGDTLHLHWRGRAYELRLEKDGARKAPRHAAAGLEAPMPGKVTKVSVAVGQQVKKGDEILVVEAMKMENQLRAPKDGRVASLRAKIGDTVGPGAVLAEIE
jgi:acetyl/propionyl-CoA carboxylase alpha subunit